MESSCRKLSIVFLGFSFSLLISQSPPDTLWTRTYGGDSIDACWSVQQTTDGGYVLVGFTNSFGAGGLDVYVVKTDSLGDTLWTKTYGGADTDLGLAIRQTSDGGYIIGGGTASFGIGNSDVYLIKTDSLGDTLWTNTYGGSEGELCRELQRTPDGGFIIVGSTSSFGNGDRNVYLIRIDQNGDTLWTKTYGDTLTDYGYGVQPTLDGGYVVAAMTGSFGAVNYDIYVLKLDSLGDTLWTLIYGGSGMDKGCYVQQTRDSCYVVTGWTSSFGSGANDIFLMKISIDGDTLWSKFYGGVGGDGAYSVHQLADDGYILAGGTWSFSAGGDAYLVRTDANGDSIWGKPFVNSYDEFCVAGGQSTSDGGFVVAGTRYTAASDSDFYLVKTGPEGGIKENKNESIKGDHHGPTILSGPLVLPEDKNCRVFDITGRVVMPDKIKPGIYFIEIDGKITRKVVKVR